MGQRNRQFVAMSFDLRAADFDRSGHDFCQVHRRFTQADLALADARHFQQVIYRPDHLQGLPLYHYPGLRHLCRIIAPLGRDLNGVADGNERVAKFVGQRRQEFNLAAEIAEKNDLASKQPMKR